MEIKLPNFVVPLNILYPAQYARDRPAKYVPLQKGQPGRFPGGPLVAKKEPSLRGCLAQTSH